MSIVFTIILILVNLFMVTFMAAIYVVKFFDKSKQCEVRNKIVALDET